MAKEKEIISLEKQRKDYNFQKTETTEVVVSVRNVNKGKKVTEIRIPHLKKSKLKEICRTHKGRFACGGSVKQNKKGNVILLQGDHKNKIVEKLFEIHGIHPVIRFLS